MDQSDSYSSVSVTLGRQHIFPVCKSVSELVREDMALWGRGMMDFKQVIGVTDPFVVFEFAQRPQSAGTHNIRIVLQTDTGKTYELAPIALTFQ